MHSGMKLGLFVLVVGGFASVGVDSQSSNSKFNWIFNRHSDFKHFIGDKGPNMCVSMDAVDEKGIPVKSFYSECMNYAPTEVCGLQTKARFHCCNGYEKETTYARGCTIVKPVKSLANTLMDEGMKNFEELWTKVDPDGSLMIRNEEERVATIFAPEKFDLEKLPLDVKSQFDAPGNNNLFYQHVVESRLKSSDLVNEALLVSKYKDGGPIRINRYTGGILTANCVRILRPNFMSTDGIIHITEDIIKPMKETDWNIVLDHPQLSKFKEYMTRTKLDVKLQQPGCITIFPPTNEAFDKLDSEVKSLIEGNVDILRKLLLHHMTDCCLCSSSIMSSSYPRTLDGGRIYLECLDGGKRFSVDDAMAVEVDHVARNGVGHVIDKVLIPDSAKTLKMKLEEQKLTHFLQLAEEAELVGLLSSRENITAFVPSNAALSLQLMAQLRGDKSLMKAFVCNHLVRGHHPTSQLIGMEFLKTINDNGNFSDQIFANVYHRYFGVNNALLIKADFLLANGVLHVMNSTLSPSSATLAERIGQMSDLSYFWSLVEKSGLDLNTTEEGTQWTVFAPKNSALSPSVDRWDEDRINQFVSKHVIKRAIFPAGLEVQNTHQYKAEDGFKLEIKGEGGQLRINKNIKVDKFDHQLKNGVLYVINRSF